MRLNNVALCHVHKDIWEQLDIKIQETDAGICFEKRQSSATGGTLP